MRRSPRRFSASSAPSSDGHPLELEGQLDARNQRTRLPKNRQDGLLSADSGQRTADGGPYFWPAASASLAAVSVLTSTTCGGTILATAVNEFSRVSPPSLVMYTHVTVPLG